MKYSRVAWLVRLELNIKIIPPLKLVKVSNKRRLGQSAQMKAEYHTTELQPTMSSVEDFFCAYNRGIQGEKQPLTCGWSFKWEPKRQLEGSGWITTSFVLMCCGHQIASRGAAAATAFGLLRGHSVHMDGSKQTHPCWGILRLQCLVGLEEALTTNLTRATQLGTCNYIMPLDRQLLGESFLWNQFNCGMNELWEPSYIKNIAAILFSLHIAVYFWRN